MRFDYEGKTFQIRYAHVRPPKLLTAPLPKDLDIRITLGGQTLVIPIGQAFKEDGYLIGHTGARSSGVTTATLGLLVNDSVIQEPGMLTRALTKFVPLAWGQASCALGDQFSKKFGRHLAFIRLEAAVRLRDPNLADVLRDAPESPFVSYNKVSNLAKKTFTEKIADMVSKPSPLFAAYKNGTGGPYIPRKK